MLNVPLTTLADTYTQFGGSTGPPLVAGTLTVANNPAVLQLFYGLHGAPQYGPEVYVAPSIFPVTAPLARALRGFQARNAVAGSNAVLFGTLFSPNDPTFGAGTPFSSTVSSSGAITPGVGVRQLAYVETTTPVSITGTTDTGATQIGLTAGPLTFDGLTRVLIEFYCPSAEEGSTAQELIFVLYENGVAIERIAWSHFGSATEVIYAARYKTPAAATITYEVRVSKGSTSAGTPFVPSNVASTGTALVPTYLRISTAPAT